MVLPKITEARDMARRCGGDIWVQVDGGVSESTIERCAAAGADVFVAGSAVFGADDPDRMVRRLREMAAAVAGE
jgi:ribulose-phosphate 3-epimerase